MKTLLEFPYLSIKNLEPIELPDLTVIHGLNGSGKTHFLRAIQDGVMALYDGEKRLSTSYLSDFKDFNPLDYQRPGLTEWHHKVYSQLSEFLERSNLVKQFIEQYTTPLQRNALSGLKGHNSIMELAVKKSQYEGKNKREEFNERVLRELHDVDPLLAPAVKSAVTFTGLSVHELNASHFNQNARTFAADFTRPELGRLFYTYMDQFRSFVENNVRKDPEYQADPTDEEFSERFGPAPWEIYNEGLRLLGMEFSFYVDLIKAAENPLTPVVLLKSGEEISFDYISSGERVMLGLAVSSMVKESQGMRIVRPDVLLLDEPDAHLHPAIVKNLFSQIIMPLVSGGTKVVIATHSPTTIALAPEGSIYLKTTAAGLRSTSKQQAINALLVGVPHLAIEFSGRRQVFTESTNDARVYQRIFDISGINSGNGRSLTFIGVGENKDGGKDRVKSTVRDLRSGGNSSIYGLIDWDLVEHDDLHVRVAGLDSYYAIENILLNPLYIAIALVKSKSVPYLNQFKFSDIRSYNNGDLQAMADIVKSHSEIPLGEASTVIEFSDGKHISVPDLFLKMYCKDYEKQIVKKFPIVKLANTTDKCLKWMIADHVLTEFPNLVPKILVDVFGKILNSD